MKDFDIMKDTESMKSIFGNGNWFVYETDMKSPAINWNNIDLVLFSFPISLWSWILKLEKSVYLV